MNSLHKCMQQLCYILVVLDGSGDVGEPVPVVSASEVRKQTVHKQRSLLK